MTSLRQLANCRRTTPPRLVPAGESVWPAALVRPAILLFFDYLALSRSPASYRAVTTVLFLPYTLGLSVLPVIHLGYHDKISVGTGPTGYVNPWSAGGTGMRPGAHIRLSGQLTRPAPRPEGARRPTPSWAVPG
jgi:hypothetical protein